MLVVFFRRQLPAKADFAEQCTRHVTRMTDSGDVESVHNQTTQGVSDSSLLAAVNAISSVLGFSGAAWNSADIQNNLHAVKSTLQTGNAIIRCDCIDECTSITLIAYCLAQYISTLNITHQKHVQSVLHSDTVNWISKLFRLVT